MQNMPCFARDKFHAKMKNKRVMFVETKERELCVFHLHNGTYKTHIFREDYKRVLIDYNMKHGDKIKLTLNTKDHYVFLHPLDKNGFPKKEGWRCITYL
jgi:lipopolysaccharide biosynthesis glycosyltransferase